MHPSLAELMESLKPGLLWVGRDGTVRYANSGATQSTGLGAGRKLFDPDLVRATAEAITSRSPRQLNVPGRCITAGGPVPELRCKVIPGLGGDDAMVLIQADPSQEHSADFDNLMLALRADVADPLRTAREALSAARDDAPARDQALAAVDELLGVMNKLLDLAQLWGGTALLGSDRMELWPLLQAVWADAEPLAHARRVAVRFRSRSQGHAPAALYGSQPWIHRVLLECLEAAIRSTRNDGALDIEYCQIGPRALIVFRDCGVFRTPDEAQARKLGTGAAPKPGAPRNAAAPSARLAARDQIGLKLCQHVIALHGGLLREENEDGQRNFLIDLPTGAPHHDDHSQLDIEQAQSYARDLSALMQRARRAAH